MAATRWVPAGTVPRSLVFLTATVVAALFAGLTVRSGSQYMDWLAERAARLEIERDQQAAIGAAGKGPALRVRCTTSWPTACRW